MHLPSSERFIAGSVVACLFVTACPVRAGTASHKLDIYWIDSEGGGSTLIVTPAGQSILVDSGNPGGRDSKRIHQVAVDAAGLRKIDYLVTTHFHLDHFGGAAELSELMPIGVVYDNGIPEHNPDGGDDAWFLEKIKPYREFKADRRLVISPGELIPLRPAEGATQVALKCLAARQQTP